MLDESLAGSPLCEEDILDILGAAQMNAPKGIVLGEISAEDLELGRMAVVFVNGEKSAVLDQLRLSIRDAGLQLLYETDSAALAAPVETAAAPRCEWLRAGLAVITLVVRSAGNSAVSQLESRRLGGADILYWSDSPEDSLRDLYFSLPRHDVRLLLSEGAQKATFDFGYSAFSIYSLLEQALAAKTANPALGSKPMVVFSLIPKPNGRAHFHCARIDVVTGHSDLFPRLDITGDCGIRGTLVGSDPGSPLILKIPIAETSKEFFPEKSGRAYVTFINGLVRTARLLRDGGLPIEKPVLTGTPENSSIRRHGVKIAAVSTLGELAALPLLSSDGSPQSHREMLAPFAVERGTFRDLREALLQAGY